MNNLKTKPESRLVLTAATAADLMTPNPISIREAATVSEAIELLTSKGYSAAPVIDDAGRPVGVLSSSDLLIHKRERADRSKAPEYYQKSDLTDVEVAFAEHYQGRDATRVRDVMTPVVFSVRPDTPADKVVEEIVALHVHRLFVVDRDQVLIGVISALDILRHLEP